MDRAPKKPPFPVGTRLRYTGERRVWYEENGQTVPLVEPGLVVTICDVDAGRRGSLRQLHDEDGPMWDEMGDPVLDQTQDGYSVYSVRATGGRPRRQIARTEGEWEVVR